jgi:hypothetical protein
MPRRTHQSEGIRDFVGKYRFDRAHQSAAGHQGCLEGVGRYVSVRIEVSTTSLCHALNVLDVPLRVNAEECFPSDRVRRQEL